MPHPDGRQNLTDLAHQLSMLARSTQKASEDLEQIALALGRGIDEATATWPGISVDIERLVTFIAARVDDDESIAEALDRLCIRDLYLVCGCLCEDERAIARLIEHYFPALDAPLSRLKLSSAEVDDTKSVLRRELFTIHRELFTPRARPTPTLANYMGRGALKSWLRVVAVRTAMQLINKRKAEVPVPNAALDRALEPQMDPELELLKRRYSQSFKQAFGRALQQLTVRERTLLRQRFIDRVAVNDLAALNRVHRATVKRWLDRAQSTLLHETRRLLREELGLSPSECESLIRLINSRLDVSLSMLGPFDE